MSNLRKIILGVLSGFIFVSAALFGPNLSAPSSHLGQLSVATVLSEIPGYVAANKKRDTLLFGLNTELERKVNALMKKQKQFVADSAGMIPLVKANQLHELEMMSQSIEQFRQSSGQALLVIDSLQINPILKMVQLAIAKVAEEHNYTHIINTDIQSQLGPPLMLYTSDTTDLLQAVLARYKEIEEEQ